MVEFYLGILYPLTNLLFEVPRKKLKLKQCGNLGEYSCFFELPPALAGGVKSIVPRALAQISLFFKTKPTNRILG